MPRLHLKISIPLLIILAFVLLYFFTKSGPAQYTTFGTSFSPYYAQQIGITDWKKAYLAILDDLKIKNLRLSAYWQYTEPAKEKYNFQDLDWQIEEASKRQVKIILTLGYRHPRWPECYIPVWAQKDKNKTPATEDVLSIIETVVKRYQNNPNITAWQVENEPLLWWFGKCPTVSTKTLDQEIALVHQLDKRPVILTDSGEFSFWWRMGKRADIFGTTMYRRSYIKLFGYIPFPLTPWIYQVRAKIIQALFKVKEVIVIELQAEPWVPQGYTFTSLPLAEQYKAINTDEIRKSIAFAQKAGFDKIYLWGAEWWYWLKETKGDSEIWNTIKSQINNFEKN